MCVSQCGQLKQPSQLSKTYRFRIYIVRLNGRSTIAAFRGATRVFGDKFHALMERNQEALYMLKTAESWLQLRLGAIAVVVLGLAAFSVVVSIEAGRTVSVGMSSIMLTYSLIFVYYLNWAVKLSTNLEAKMNSAERILQYHHQEEDSSSDENNKNNSGNVWEPTHGRLEVDGIYMTYDDNTKENSDDVTWALQDVTATVEPGSKLALIGRTGSGKSSFVASLFRLVDVSRGSIRIDGVRAQDVPIKQWRRSIGIIPQQPTLFAGSVRDNIDPYGRHDDDTIRDVLKRVQLRERLAHVELSTTPIDSLGLSAGEKQLLCVCRALLSKPKICCLDEATSSVDMQTDAVIQRVVREDLEDAAVITIAHRTNTVADYEQVLVLDRGTVARRCTGADINDVVASDTVHY
eukprot:TRINITY_DN62565_c0_g1_i1.p1 TRINITY_DN62565_c0_g1~~TRINITY_DN62565_c0_g1_i1.p1  ORF type:complete len:405 (+),score=156.22 TRINITY_DN62565_c0_g1_i1:59-1273(+)